MMKFNKVKAYIGGVVASAGMAVISSAGAQTITPVTIAVPTSTVPNLAAQIGSLISDPGLLSVVVIAVALPLAFWLYHAVKGLFPGSRSRKS